LKKILFITYEFPPDIGGAGIVAHDCAAYLTNSGFNVQVLTRFNKARKYNSFPFSCEQIKIIPKLYPILFYLKLLILGLAQFDKIILNDIAGILTAAFFFNRKLQRKCIVYMHGGEVDEIFINRSILNIILNFSTKYRLLLKHCQNIVFVSDFLKNKFISYGRTNILTDKVAVIPNGVDNDIFRPSKINLYKELAIPPQKKILLSTGRIIAGKGYKKMYNIFLKLINEGYLYHWIIIGSGAFINTLIQQAKKDKVSDNITILENISRQNLFLYYSSADVFWLLSDFEESFGLGYIESASCGTPVIARNAFGAIESVILDFARNFHFTNSMPKLINLLNLNGQ